MLSLSQHDVFLTYCSSNKTIPYFLPALVHLRIFVPLKSKSGAPGECGLMTYGSP